MSETSVYDSTSPESEYHNKSETVKEYLVSDEIAEMFRSWCRYQAESKLAKKLAKLNGTYEEETAEEETTAEVTVTEETTEAETTSETETTTETTVTETTVVTETTTKDEKTTQITH